MVANVLVTVTIFVKTIKLGFEIQFVKIEFWLIFFLILYILNYLNHGLLYVV
jgi:hypothetical protein